MSMMTEFKESLIKVDAVDVLIGAMFGKIVSSLE